MRDEKPTWFNKSGLGCDPVAAHGAPVSFTAHGEGLLPGQNLVMDMTALQNGYRTPYYIDEIRMQSYMGNPDVTTALLETGYATAFLFRVGQYAFAERATPMLLHQPQYNTQPNQLLSKFTGPTTDRLGTDARWLLAKPLLMMPGDAIQCTAFRSTTAMAGDGTNPFTVDVTYVGRALPPGASVPAVRHVPWIAHYTHDFANAYSDSGNKFQSPFLDKVLNVHRFVARTMSNATVRTSVPASGNFGTNMLPSPLGGKYAAVDIEDSQAYKITRTFTPAGLIFDADRCTWTFNRPLGPREQYNMKFQTQGSVGTNLVFSVAMHGCREEG